MDERLFKVLDRIEEIQARMAEKQSHMAEVLAAQAVQLKEHMKRSDANEEAVELLKKHVYMVQGVGAFLAIIATVVGIYAALK